MGFPMEWVKLYISEAHVRKRAIADSPRNSVLGKGAHSWALVWDSGTWYRINIVVPLYVSEYLLVVWRLPCWNIFQDSLKLYVRALEFNRKYLIQ